MNKGPDPAEPPQRAVERLLRTTVTDVSPRGGSLFSITVGDGSIVLAKRAPGPRAHTAEAAGLRWLAASDDIPLPAVYGHDADWLLIEPVSSGTPTVAAAERFGAGLARLHLRGAPAFGSPPPGGPEQAWIGLAGMHNIAEDDWPTFYARHRIHPYVRAARDAELIDADQATVFDQVCARIDSLAGPAEQPSRLHGDAWSGNVHWSDPSIDGRVWLLDPAAHGGHRETDLAMLHLFGAPMLEHILQAYTEAATESGYPLRDGWRERVSLHQLFPLLVHTVLFGGGFAHQALAAARAALALR